MKVLVVDDEHIICENLKSKIMRFDHGRPYTVLMANAVAEAEPIYREEQPDVILVDINMPGISGLTMIEKIHKSSYRPVIFVLSGYDDYDYVRRAFLAGADDYILKPISFSELDEKFRKLKGPPGEESAPPDKGGTIIENALLYIHENMASNLVMSSVAAYVSVSYSHFSKLFRAATNQSFPHYLHKIRMEKAKDYLADPCIPIGSIAQKVGYKYDPQHFSRDFSKYAGVSPSQYRKELCQASLETQAPRDK